MASCNDYKFNVKDYLPDYCCMHLSEKCRIGSGYLRAFTEKSYNKFITCQKRWNLLQCKQSEIGIVSIDEIQSNVKKPGYHSECYTAFTNITLIKRAEDRFQKQKDIADKSLSTEESMCASPPKRMMRSFISSTETGRSPHVLPVRCIVCRGCKYAVEASSRKRKLEKLVMCETEQCGQLLQAATVRQDRTMLLDIRDKDLVAIEVRYHHSCYLKYTRCVRTSNTETTDSILKQYQRAYDIFCDRYIDSRIIKGKEIFRLTKLNKLFIKTVRDVESKDASNYITARLKKRLQNSHPALSFTRPLRQFESELVYTDNLEVPDVIETVVTYQSSESEESETCSTNSSPVKQNTGTPGMYEPIKTVFAAAQVLKTTMDLENLPSITVWPPTSDELTLDMARAIIPYELFNFLAWLVDIADDPILTHMVKVSTKDECRLLSIAQDILYLKARGRMIMPKHTALAMAIRHLTGSSKLISLMNGLGHCISNTKVLEHDTALARRQLILGENILPSGTASIFTTLVWDNNDFGEETLTGKGTTHNTNGILIQRPVHSDEVFTRDKVTVPKSRERTIAPVHSQIQKYYGLKKKGPLPYGLTVPLEQANHVEVQEFPRSVDLAVMLMKLVTEAETCFPGWTGCNTLLHTDIPAKCTVGYLPIIDASPTQYDTVYTILLRSLEIADRINQKNIVVVFDQAIYSKAQQIRWRNEEFSERIVIRLGAFHTAMAMLACIGKRFHDAGLENIMVEANIVAQGSINGVRTGHHYNRSVRANKCIMEAMERLRWKMFLSTLTTEEYSEVMEVLLDLNESFPNTSFIDCVKSDRFGDVMTQYRQFVTDNSSRNPTFSLWSSYIEMVENLLLFIRATREGNFELHLSCIRTFLPWFFAYDHTNYARYLPIYWIEMCQLESTHPDVYLAVMRGEFAVQRQDDYGFSQIACDQTIEQTVNRDSKTKGGMIGYTTNKNAVQRWILSQHERSAISKRCDEMTGKSEGIRWKKDLDKSRMKADDTAVCSACEVIESMVHPFHESEEQLVHIASGKVASNEVKKDYMEAQHKGELALVEYCKDRLQEDKKDMFAVIKKNKLKTFASMGKSTVSRVKGKEVTLTANRNLFQRLIIIATRRKLDLRKMLSHNLGPLPMSLATFNGCLTKTTKASMLHFIESKMEPKPVIENIPHGSIWIVDGMALIQELSARSIPSTFGLLVDHILRQLITLAKTTHSDSVHFVTDTYPQMSIKNVERNKRATSGAQITKIYGKDQKVPTLWKQFLAYSDNKVSLVNFIFDTWCKYPIEEFQGVTVFIAHNESCHSVCGTVTNIAELACTHEEADTRLLLHSKYAADIQHQQHIIIRSPDTDVFVIGISKANMIDSELLFHTGRGESRRTISLTTIRQHLGDTISNALIGLHCFTGCDSVSAFYAKGKAKAIKLMMGNPTYQEAFQMVGSSFTVQQDTENKICKFVCQLYGQHDCYDVNEARYRMFLLVKDESMLPPTKDALQQHLLRANYQAAIHHLCMQQFPAIPTPANHGWNILPDNDLDILWGDLPPAPDSLLEFTNCSCKKSNCKALTTGKKKCPCLENKVECTGLCKCVDCDNTNSSSDGDYDTDIDSDSDNDE